MDKHLPEFGSLSSSRGIHHALHHRPDGLHEGIEFIVRGRPDFEFKFWFFVSFFPEFQPGVFCICSDPAHLKVTTSWIPSRSDVYRFRPEPESTRESLEPLIHDLPLVRPFLDDSASRLLSDPLRSLAVSFLSAELPRDREEARLFVRDRLIERGAQLRLPVSQTRAISGMARQIIERTFHEGNHRSATNPAMTQQLQSGIHWRGVVDPKR